MIAEAHMDKPNPCHFFMSTYWMFTYATEIQLAEIFGMSEKTARAHIWKYVKAIQALKAQKVCNNGGPWVPSSMLGCCHYVLGQVKEGTASKDLAGHKFCLTVCRSYSEARQ
jgi:hypothetical protein